MRVVNLSDTPCNYTLSRRNKGATGGNIIAKDMGAISASNRVVATGGSMCTLLLVSQAVAFF